MRQLILFVACIVLACVGANAQKMDASKVPAAVKASFAKQYPSAKAVKWEKEDNNYEVALNNDGKDMTIVLDAKGTLVETELGIKSTELPAGALKYVSDHFKGKTILSADKITAGNKVTYEVVVQKGKALIFDATGKFLETAKD